MKGRSRKDEEIDYNGALIAILNDDNEKFAKIMSHASTPDLFFNLSQIELPKIIAGFPPLLSLAAFFGAEKCVDVLIEMKPNFNRQDKFGRLPIHFAAAGGNIKIVDKIAPKPEHFQKVDQYGDTPLSYSVMFGHIEATKHIIEFFEEYDKQYLLDIASRFGHLDCVKYFVETLGADVNKGALSAACSAGNVNVARYLIQEGADVNLPDGDGVTPIIDAINSGSLPMVCYLMRKGANFTESNSKYTPIVECAACGFLDIFDFMVKRGADINAFNAYGKRPLQAALERKYPTLIHYILDHDGSAPDMTNIIKTAIKVGDPHSLGHLLDVIGDPFGELSKPSVIATALNSGEFDLIRTIIDNGAVISTQDIIFYNLLKRAIKNNAVDIVRLFIDKGLELKKCKGTMKYVFELINERKTEEPSQELVQIMNILLASGADLCEGASKTEMFFRLLKLDSIEALEAVKNNCPNFDLPKLIDLNRMNVRNHFFTRDDNVSHVLPYFYTQLEDVNAECEGEGTFLHTAVQYHGSIKLIKTLLEIGADINYLNSYGSSPLLLAAYFKRPNLAHFLIDCGADTTIRGKHGETLIEVTARSDLNAYLLHRLITSGFDFGSSLNVALNNGAYYNAYMLIKHGADYSFMHNAKKINACFGEDDILRQLIKEKPMSVCKRIRKALFK